MRDRRRIVLLALMTTLAACQLDEEAGEGGEGSGIPASGGAMQRRQRSL